MSKRRAAVKLVPIDDRQHFQDLRIAHEGTWTLGELLRHAPALSLEPFDAAYLDRKLEDLNIQLINEPLYLPPGFRVSAPLGNDSDPANPSGSEATRHTLAGKDLDCRDRTGAEPSDPGADRPFAQGAVNDETVPESKRSGTYPVEICERDAVVQAYSHEIAKAASFLRAGLSLLIFCDKLVVEHLWREIVTLANKEPMLLEVPDDEGESIMPRSMRQRQLAMLKMLIRNLKQNHVLVIRHLDLLAGGSDSNLPTESRELIELAYEASDRLVLAFADRSLDVPEVLAARFAVRLMITGVSRTVVTPRGERQVGEALVTAAEAAHFRDYDPEGLYKNVAGMNPIRLRDAIRYAVQEYAETEPVPVTKLYEALRAFKAQTSAKFEVPNVNFDDIGGYEEVKDELKEAIQLMLGGYAVDPKLRSELIPRGFIFYGPPGTGKTLFAKAVANQMNATIQVVSGPEVTDMYVGESERKVRELFAEARRNAPAVLVFDEFDSIASKRSGREDGGSRAGNALVAQILTEMDGFRPDVPLLVIGTTNRLDIIDEALMRPSRFKAVQIGYPNRMACKAIAQVHARHFGIDVQPAVLDILADSTHGMNGDEIRSIFRDACVALKFHGIEPDARHLGKLVGKIRQASQQRLISNTAHQAAPTAPTRQGQRPGPSGPMISQTPTSSIPARAQSAQPADQHSTNPSNPLASPGAAP